MKKLALLRAVLVFDEAVDIHEKMRGIVCLRNEVLEGGVGGHGERKDLIVLLVVVVVRS